MPVYYPEVFPPFPASDVFETLLLFLAPELRDDVTEFACYEFFPAGRFLAVPAFPLCSLAFVPGAFL